MITGPHTNTVYLSQLLQTDPRFQQTCNNLVHLLSKHGIKTRFLKETKDIWCRDYMPVQLGKGKFVQFRYEPFYLNDYPHLRSGPKVVCEANGIYPRYSVINLDGGNVVYWSDKAIISDRVYSENPEYTSKRQLVADIEELLGMEVIIIPQIKSDMTGHADGLVRFVNSNTLLGNHRGSEYKYWVKGINKVLKDYGLDYIDVPFFQHKNKDYPDNALGCYVNYLEIQHLIVLPVFETDNNKDEEVQVLFAQIFPDRTIETINFNAVGLHGGLLNCATWTVFSN